MPKTNIKALKKSVWVYFSKYIRYRDCVLTTGSKNFGKCISCKKTFLFQQLQAGHFISGRGNAVLFDEEIVHAQCMRCNIFLSGNIFDYEQSLIEMYGAKKVQELKNKRHQIKSYSEEELKQLLFKYKSLTLGI